MLNIFSPKSASGKTVYAITFNNVDKLPDLEMDEEVMSHIDITLKNTNSYVVASDINDKSLKELLMSTFDLKASQVFVSSRRFV